MSVVVNATGKVVSFVDDRITPTPLRIHIARDADDREAAREELGAAASWGAAAARLAIGSG